ncbi:hypothetical protein Lalb_Chr05g0227411 [Lupinus albus]|uniref:Uncharacterized protein n=1 Tax=Lupinus albus TaxID=3870 RepID=A0A6A4QM61_LUPAL|nr:hypothetical protein Lalb_Chr05g0227411 [Lupinus albus]
MMMQVCLIYLWVLDDHMEPAKFRIFIMYFIFKVLYQITFSFLRFYSIFVFIMKDEL